jgi:hypothetical protein
MNKKQTKSELRQQLQSELDEFLQKGGNVKSMNIGDTALVNGRLNPYPATEKKQEIPKNSNILQSTDEHTHKHSLIKQKDKSPKQKIIYDDFGEAVRIIWQ